nr:uncharacterized protein LOC128700330 [Cherax quadricarinatus]
MMKPIATILLLMWTFNVAAAFLCYSHDPENDKSSVVFCQNSCYSVGVKLFALERLKKGCADKTYEYGCKTGDFLGLAGGHMCFCNTILCNTSSVSFVVMPLLIISLLLLRLL